MLDKQTNKQYKRVDALFYWKEMDIRVNKIRVSQDNNIKETLNNIIREAFKTASIKINQKLMVKKLKAINTSKSRPNSISTTSRKSSSTACEYPKSLGLNRLKNRLINPEEIDLISIQFVNSVTSRKGTLYEIEIALFDNTDDSFRLFTEGIKEFSKFVKC
uniref:Uncharacterized protein n=1 Tax=Clytia hemisphaerica TaxID=252671 RepID=A0A7M5V907_9CNID